MQTNNAIQNTGLVSWDGAASTPRDITGHVSFAWSFEVTADIATDAVFTVQAAPGSDADPCVPGTFEDVEDVVICMGEATASGLAEITIPAGTVAGSVCAASIPCRAGKFIQLVAASGDTANVTAVLVLSGPTR